MSKEWKMVPVEPTDEMLKAADKANVAAYVGGSHRGASFEDEWYAALDAAPVPPTHSRQPAKREHLLYRDGDSCIPEAILDRNGQVVLDMCTVCGKGEAELSGPCEGVETLAKDGQ